MCVEKSNWLFAISTICWTGAILAISASFLLVDRPPAIVRSADGDLSTVRQFYETVNGAIESGDTSSLKQVISPALLIDQNSLSGLSEVGGLEEHLIYLHSVASGIRLEARLFPGNGGEVVSIVEVAGAVPHSALGFELEPNSIWPSSENFLVSGGKIIERNANRNRSVSFDPQTGINHLIRFGNSGKLQVVRWAITGGTNAGFETGNSSSIFFVQDGAIEFSLDAPVSGSSHVALCISDYASSIEHFRQALTLSIQAHIRLMDGFVLADLAMATHRAGQLDRAALLFGAAEAIWDRQGCSEVARMALSSWNGELQALREQMADPALEDFLYQGRTLSIEAAYAQAMALPSDTSNRPSSGLRLSRRALEVLALVGEGLTNREIADALFVSKRTIDDHLVKIFAILGVSSRREAVREARKRGHLPS